MFIGFTKRLKAMSGFRIGFGIRINKRNYWYFLFAMMFLGLFYAMWYMIIFVGWMLYYMMYGIYKIYYFMFKYAAIGCKKLYSFIKAKLQEKAINEDTAK